VGQDELMLRGGVITASSAASGLHELGPSALCASPSARRLPHAESVYRKGADSRPSRLRARPRDVRASLPPRNPAIRPPRPALPRPQPSSSSLCS
jgi:hypothetical protein